MHEKITGKMLLKQQGLRCSMGISRFVLSLK